MPREDTSSQLTGLQLTLLRVLWSRGESTISEVHAALTGARELAPTTVATLLRRLEKRGLVSHSTQGRQFVYRAEISEHDATRSMVDEVTERLFAGDVSEMMAQLLTSKDVRAGDLDRIRALIEEKERELEE
jgi:predicted transcriptional regulator